MNKLLYWYFNNLQSYIVFSKSKSFFCFPPAKAVILSPIHKVGVP